MLGTLAALGALPVVGGFFLLLKFRYKAWRDSQSENAERH